MPLPDECEASRWRCGATPHHAQASVYDLTCHGATLLAVEAEVAAQQARSYEAFKVSAVSDDLTLTLPLSLSFFLSFYVSLDFSLFTSP